MILRGWHIDGFGLWHDHRVEDLAPGLNLLHGPNEVGKTTLHAFIRGVLYGFSDRRSREPLYEPLRGGSRGGSLLVESREEGALTISRRGRGRKSAVVETAAGERLDEAVLARLLRGTDAALFRQVFAFGLDELASLDLLQGDEVGLRLFDAGLEGAGRSVAGLVAELNKRKEAEHKSRKGRLRELAAAVLAARRELEQAVARAKGHGELAGRELASERRLQAWRAEVETLRGAKERWEALLGLWPVELRRREALAALAEAPEPGALLALAPRLEAQRGSAQLHEDRRRRLLEEKQRLAGLEGLLARGWRSLGAGWSEERLLQIERGEVRKAAIERHRQTLAEAEQRLQRVEAERQRLVMEARRLEAEGEQLVGLEVQAGEGPRDEEALCLRRGALAELRGALEDEKTAARRMADLEDRRGGSRGAALLAVGISVCCALGAGIAWAGGAWLAALVAGGAALAAGVLALLLRQHPEAAARRGEAARVLAGERERVIAACRALGLEEEPTPAALERLALELEEAGRQLRERQELQRRHAELQLRRAGVESDLRQVQRAVQAAEIAHTEARAAWRHHAEDLGGELEPEEAKEVLQQLERQAELLDGRATIRSSIAGLQRRMLEWENETEALLEAAGIAEGGEAGLRLLTARLECAGELRQAERQISERLGEGEEGQRRRAELEQGQKESWQRAFEEAEAKLAERDAAITGEVSGLALLRKERQTLERSADVAAGAALLGAREAAFAASVARYREAALLERLLRDSLERYQQDRQPQVLRHAGEAFRRITGGRYRQVRQPPGTTRLEVVDAAGKPVAAGELSRGAREQLYICLRLGLARAFAERGMRLPLLLDDVFVNADPERAAALAAVLADFAGEHQVLLFTCHPQTVERVATAAPGCRRIDLAQVGAGEGSRVA